MSLFRVAGLLVVSLAVAAPGWAAEPPLETVLTNALEASAAGWNRGDLDAFIAVYDARATFMAKEGPIGVAAMRDHFRQKYFVNGRPRQALRFERVAVHRLGETHALMTARWVLANGAQPEPSGWTSLLWARTAVGWRIVHDHSS